MPGLLTKDRHFAKSVLTTRIRSCICGDNLRSVSALNEFEKSKAGDRIRTGDVQLGKPPEVGSNLIANQPLTASSNLACTPACTTKHPTTQALSVEDLAMALAKLSPKDRDKLALLLAGMANAVNG
jgi:hypothetical protein